MLALFFAIASFLLAVLGAEPKDARLALALAALLTAAAHFAQ